MAASEAAVREAGLPATVAIRDGRLLVGLEANDLEALANAPTGSVRKAAWPSLAIALAASGWAATTVSATMIAAHAAGTGQRVRGGIGGVHRGRSASPARQARPRSTSRPTSRTRTPSRPCAGPKAILDAAHAEYLRDAASLSSPPATRAAGFYARFERDRRPLRRRCRRPPCAAALHLGLGLEARSSCAPVPADAALPEDVAHDAVEQAIAEAEASAVHGPALTPWLLARVAALTEGASVRANTALIVNDARVAGRSQHTCLDGRGGARYTRRTPTSVSRMRTAAVSRRDRFLKETRCGSTRAALGRTSRRSSARLARSSISAGCAT